MQCHFTKTLLPSILYFVPNNTPPPLLPITGFICFSPFKIPILPQFFFLSDLVKTKLNLHIFKCIFFKSAQSDVFKEMWVSILKGLKHPNIVYWKPTPLKLV